MANRERSRASGSIIEQPGRLLADGTRRGARTAKKATFYLDLSVATQLKMRAASDNISASELVGRALVEYFARAAKASKKKR